MKKHTAIILIVAVVALVGRVLYVMTGEETITAEYPLNHLVLDRGYIGIHISEEAQLDDVLNLKVFEGLRPDMSSDDINNKFGPPQDITNRYETKFSVFYTNNGRIEYGNSFGQLSSGATYDTNLLMFFKEDIASELIFKEIVLKYLPDDVEDIQIGVFERGNCNFIIELSTTKDDWIQWRYENRN